jgi:membrane protein DedA with SNARE-associated domain
MEALLHSLLLYRHLVIFIGTFIEGEVVLIAGGFLVAEGQLGFFTLVSTATVAAVLGDHLFYWIGRSHRVGSRHPWATRLLAFIGEHRLFKGEEFVRRHGGKSVFVVRFFYGLRFAGAMTAGLLGMNLGRFFFFNFAGCFVWALIFAGFGTFFSRSLAGLARGWRLSEIAFTLIISGLLAIYFMNRRTRKTASR